jgi:hypothetical protein
LPQLAADAAGQRGIEQVEHVARVGRIAPSRQRRLFQGYMPDLDAACIEPELRGARHQQVAIAQYHQRPATRVRQAAGRCPGRSPPVRRK